MWNGRFDEGRRWVPVIDRGDEGIVVVEVVSSLGVWWFCLIWAIGLGAAAAAAAAASAGAGSSKLRQVRAGVQATRLQDGTYPLWLVVRAPVRLGPTHDTA